MPRKAKKKNDGQKPKTQQTDKTVNDEKVEDKNQEVVVKKKGKNAVENLNPKAIFQKGLLKKEGGNQKVEK